MKKLLLLAFILFLPLAAPAAVGHRGAVLNVLQVDNYTYVEIDDSGVKKWIACPTLEVAAGDVVEASYGMMMPDFESKSLNRTFKEIYFVTFAKVVSRKPSAVNRHTEAPAPGRIADIKKPADAIDLKTLFSRGATLKGKKVVVVGQVTKATTGVMGVNWLHLTDNSGDAKPLDLTVTTADVAAVGDIVRIEGVLDTEKDFGMGYFFPVIVENAKVKPYKP